MSDDTGTIFQLQGRLLSKAGYTFLDGRRAAGNLVQCVDFNDPRHPLESQSELASPYRFALGLERRSGVHRENVVDRLRGPLIMW